MTDNNYSDSSQNQTPTPTPTWQPNGYQAPAAVQQTQVPVEATQNSINQGLTPAAPISEELADQNIFELLGVTDGSDAERESFLDELQQVIWEDFIENDVALLLTSNEMAELKAMLDNSSQPEAQKQEATVNFLEKLIPGLEDIMLDKALELKEEMFRERVVGVKDFYKGQADKLAKIAESEKLVAEGKWRSGANLLNQLK